MMEDVESGRGGHTQGRMHGMEIWGRCFASRGKRRRRERWCTLRAGKKGGGEGEVGGKSDAYTRAPEGVIVGGVGANERHFLSRRRRPPLLFFPPTLLPVDGESCQGREGARAFPARRENAEIPARHERSEGREVFILVLYGMRLQSSRGSGGDNTSMVCDPRKKRRKKKNELWRCRHVLQVREESERKEKSKTYHSSRRCTKFQTEKLNSSARKWPNASRRALYGTCIQEVLFFVRETETKAGAA